MSATDMDFTTFTDRVCPVAAVVINHGEIACFNAAGYITPGAIATGLVAYGICKRSVDNSGGSAGDLETVVATSHGKGGVRVFPLKNAAGGDAVDQADVGRDCWVFSANTVSGTSNGGTRSRAGKVHGFDDEDNVLVEFDMLPAELADVAADLAAVTELAEAAPAMQAVNATLAAGTVTIDTGITVAADSEVFPQLIGALSGTTNFGMLGELKAARVNGAPGAGTVVIQAYGDDGALDADAAGAIRVVILTPQV